MPSSKPSMKRYREIMHVLTQNGLGFVFVKTAITRNPQKELDRHNDDPTTPSVAERIRKSCEQLGPTFVKLGQILSTRTDIIPESLAAELQKLQDDVPPFSFEGARGLIESELEDSIENIYVDFDQTPVASASVSQVYQAYLHSGAKVAVKVQRPGVLDIIETDLDILLRLARFVDRHTKYGKLYDFEGMVQELRKVMEQEMNFLHEGNNIDRFRQNLANDPHVNAPKVRWMYTTSKVLTMDYANGHKINDLEAIDRIGVDRRWIAELLANSLLRQILVDGFFHADPHPGNILVRPDGKGIEFIDLGMVGELSDHFRRQLADLMVGVATQNTRKIAQAIMDMDTAGAKVDMNKFTKTLNHMLDEYLYVDLAEVNIARVFTSVFSLAGEFKMKIAREFALVAKSLGTAQIIVEELAPHTSMLDISKKTVSDLIKKPFSPEELKKTLETGVVDTADIVKGLPTLILNLMRKAEDNDFAIDMNIKHLEEMDKNIERMTNRLSFTVVLLAVCIVLAGVIIAIGFSAQSYPDLMEFNFFALRVGLVVAFAIVAGLVFNMIYSNIKKH